MSFIVEYERSFSAVKSLLTANKSKSQMKRADSQLDRFHLAVVSANRRSISEQHDPDHSEPQPALKALKVEAAVRELSNANSSRTILTPSQVLSTLRTIQNQSEPSGRADQLQWLLVGKATNQVFGIVLHALLDQILPLHGDLGYWDSVLGSYRYTSLYSIQTSPLRLWDWTRDIYTDVKERFDRSGNGGIEHQATSNSTPREDLASSRSLREQWAIFYNLVRNSVEQRSMLHVRSAVVSPLAQVEDEVRKKRKGIRKLMEMSASGLGLLMDECLSFAAHNENASMANGTEDLSPSPTKKDWKSVVEESVALIESVLVKVTSMDIPVPEFDEAVFSSVEVDPEEPNEDTETGSSETRPALLAGRLCRILNEQLPAHTKASSTLAQGYGRPSRMIRYWLPATVLILSSSTILRLLLKRKARVRVWFRESVEIAIDFWRNWVVEPAKKIVATVRHDQDSEIAIMSKRSLEGDRASLERMVVDFAVDTGPRSLDESAIADIRSKVQEGDLTSVLVAYEKDLRRPFMGTVRGDLIRALLIQVQKTKVDIEVAMGGIDALLKSQELVFGFVGLTPGILVCLATSRWLASLFGGRRGSGLERDKWRMTKSLRNIDRIATAAEPANKILSYRDHGMLLCEVHVLRQKASTVLPKDACRDFVDDLEDLVDIRTGLERQTATIRRIVWSYSKWLQ